ncbi:MAG: flagellar motor protein MotB [Rhodanobacteraceae bacterium]
MRRKPSETESFNHESWAIPYGDLITLLLAFFVTMYALSSVNVSRYKELAEALHAVFTGQPRTFKPIQLGHDDITGTHANNRIQIIPPSHPAASVMPSVIQASPRLPAIPLPLPPQSAAHASAEASLDRISKALLKALEPLIQKKLVAVRRTASWLEIQIGSDVLFRSGSADPLPDARTISTKIGDVLKPFGNSLRVEGFTDDRPIHTSRFPSNWELSTARAASIAHLIIADGVDPDRVSLTGYGQYHPIASNATAAGRARNRRVDVVVFANNKTLRGQVNGPIGQAPSGTPARDPVVDQGGSATDDPAASADAGGQ